MADNDWVTAAELMARLERDPEFQKRKAEKAQRRALQRARLDDIQRPMLAELASLGFPANSIDEIGRWYAPLPTQLVQSLLRWLPQVRDEAIQQAIVQLLLRAKEPFDGRPLVACFERSGTETSIRYAIANTIAEMHPFGITDWVVEGVKNPLFGTARQVLVLALARMAPHSIALPILRSLLDQLPGHVAGALGEIGGAVEIDELQARLPSVQRDWERKEITKAIRTIQSRSQAELP